MSDTPIVDAETEIECPYGTVQAYIRMRDLARKLERERAEALNGYASTLRLLEVVTAKRDSLERELAAATSERQAIYDELMVRAMNAEGQLRVVHAENDALRDEIKRLRLNQRDNDRG